MLEQCGKSRHRALIDDRINGDLYVGMEAHQGSLEGVRPADRIVLEEISGNCVPPSWFAA